MCVDIYIESILLILHRLHRLVVNALDWRSLAWSDLLENFPCSPNISPAKMIYFKGSRKRGSSTSYDLGLNTYVHYSTNNIILHLLSILLLLKVHDSNVDFQIILEKGIHSIWNLFIKFQSNVAINKHGWKHKPTCPCPREMELNLFPPNPLSSANLSKLMVGSAPGDRMNMSGVHGLESL